MFGYEEEQMLMEKAYQEMINEYVRKITDAKVLKALLCLVKKIHKNESG